MRSPTRSTSSRRNQLREQLQWLLERPPTLVPYQEVDATLFPRFLNGVLGLTS